MTQYQRDFVNLMLSVGALKFGNFTLKSGRQSPFFMNTGVFCDGKSLSSLCRTYAKAIYDEYGDDFDVLFGPAYKGIPLASTVTTILADNFGINVRYCSNRKEIKDHGDTGILLGTKLKDGDKIVIIEDVITSGASMEETVPILRAQANVTIVGSMVSLDRHEVGKGGKITALKEVSELYGFPTAAIVSMPEIVEYLKENSELKNSTKSATRCWLVLMNTTPSTDRRRGKGYMDFRPEQIIERIAKNYQDISEHIRNYVA